MKRDNCFSPARRVYRVFSFTIVDFNFKMCLVGLNVFKGMGATCCSNYPGLFDKSVFLLGIIDKYEN